MNQHPDYELFEELGRGVNTVVYRSYDLSLGREVAIKELDERGRRDPRHREQFLREARFLAQFEHENVLRVYSVDNERGWIVMELMKGTLASIIADGPSDPDLVRSVLKQTLEALAFLHEKNKVHGTVRPTNLLINESGRVKLSEFEQTDVGGELRVPKGSKKYLAPELIRPEFGQFGPALDLYCLAFTALELLKGAQFDGLFPGTGKGAIDADIAWLRWHSSPEELPSVRKLVKGIPDDLAHVLDRMLKKRVDDRPQSAQDVLQELADRPFVAVRVAGSAADDDGVRDDRVVHAPAVVRTLAPGQQVVLASGSNPSIASGGTSAKSTNSHGGEKPVRERKSADVSKRGAPRFSKDWFNQQLSRPLVLYPLCAVILLGALWLSIRLNMGGDVDGASKMVAVTFDIDPDSDGVTIVDQRDKRAVAAQDDGSYDFAPGSYTLTFSKPGFEAVTREFEISAEKNKFAVKLKPLIEFHDIAVTLTPPESRLTIGGTAQTTVDGAYTHKLQEGETLEIAAQLDGFVNFSRTYTSEELAQAGYKVSIELEREKPRLPSSLVAKPGAAIDPEVQLPVRVLATRFGDGEVLELALVKPGSYTFGSSSDELREGELAKRVVRIEQPYYIAIHETTNAQFEQFVATSGRSTDGRRWQRAARKWAEPLRLDPVKNQLPATNVSVEQAQSFCQWVGGRLPSEVEWESAVRGSDRHGYPYPWGTELPDRDRCQIFRGQLGPVTVDELNAGASSLGLLNTIGNAAEWCSDDEQSGAFILRGCSFATANIDDVRVTWRRRGNTNGEEDTGFRVVVPIGNERSATIAGTVESSETVTTSSDKDETSLSGSAALPTPLWFVTSVPWRAISRAAGIAE